MMLTAHWSVSPPERLNVYHVEFALRTNLPTSYIDNCYTILKAPTQQNLTQFNWEKLFYYFDVWKNFDFNQALAYGTFRLNHDPRDKSTNIQIAAMTMDGSVQVSGPWGTHPYTAAHALMHCAIMARIAKLKDIDVLTSFGVEVEPDVLQNGPIYVLSTHGCRAYETQDEGEDTVPDLGYGLGSGDGDCRWDCAALDPRDAHLLNTTSNAHKTCYESADTLRQITHILKTLPMQNMMSLDK